MKSRLGGPFLARSHWGGRYNSEMKHLMLQHAFKYVRNVVLLIGPGNFRSRKAAEKIGAAYAGTRSGPDGLEKIVYRISAP